jgi:hypothetical protein
MFSVLLSVKSKITNIFQTDQLNSFIQAQLARLDAPSAPIADSNSLPLPAHFQRVVSSEELIFDSSDDEPELLNDVAAKKDREQRVKIKRETAELERERYELLPLHRKIFRQ